MLSSEGTQLKLLVTASIALHLRKRATRRDGRRRLLIKPAISTLIKAACKLYSDLSFHSKLA